MRFTVPMTTDEFPRWPPEWVEDRELATEEVLQAAEGVELTSALSGDDRILLSVSWPGGRRYMLVDPVGNEAPRALRIGEVAEDPQTARLIDLLWSRALELAKRLTDGDHEALAREAQEAYEAMAAQARGEDVEGGAKRRLPWRRRG